MKSLHCQNEAKEEDKISLLVYIKNVKQDNYIRAIGLKGKFPIFKKKLNNMGKLLFIIKRNVYYQK